MYLYIKADWMHPMRESGRFPVDSFEEASKLYADIRDASNEGSSTFPVGKVEACDGVVYTVSYNGRIWFADSLVYDPFGMKTFR